MAPFEQLSVDTDGGNQVVSYLMTKHEKMLGLIPMQQSSLLELTRAGLITRDPETNCITNSWLFGDLLYIAAAGARLSLSINTKGNPLLCCLGDTKKLDCSFADAKEAASICTAIEQAMVHGYDESTVQRSAILAADDAQPAAAEPVAETEPLASLNDTMTDALVSSTPAESEPPTTPDAAEATEELASKAAVAEVQNVLEGLSCLAGGEHVWRPYDGQRGSGRCCERCFMCQDALHRVLWRISPPLAEETTGDTVNEGPKILATWRQELERVINGDGCIAGGAHAWLDSNMTMLRLTSPAKCCKQCGVVRDDQGRLVVLPNMLGHFGPPSVKSYGA